jgi:hypothetical protein
MSFTTLTRKALLSMTNMANNGSSSKSLPPTLSLTKLIPPTAARVQDKADKPASHFRDYNSERSAANLVFAMQKKVSSSTAFLHARNY